MVIIETVVTKSQLFNNYELCGHAVGIFFDDKTTRQLTKRAFFGGSSILL